MGRLWMSIPVVLALVVSGSSRAQDAVAVSTGGASTGGSREDVKGITQYPSSTQFGLDRLTLRSGPGADIFWNVDAFARGDGDSRFEATWQRPGTWRLRVELAYPVTYDGVGSTNYAPAVPSFFGTAPRFFSLDAEPRRWYGWGSLFFDAQIGERSSVYAQASYGEQGGTLRAMRGGSFGSSVDFSVPTLERREGNWWELALGGATQAGPATLSLELSRARSQPGRTQWVEQFGGFALDRTLVDFTRHQVNSTNAKASLLVEAPSGKWDASLGVEASQAKNRPGSSLTVKDRLFPGANWTGHELLASRHALSLFATANWMPTEGVLVAYGASLTQEKVESTGVDEVGPWFPAALLPVEERGWSHQESLQASYSPSARIYLLAGGSFGWRRYDRTEGGDTRRDDGQRNSYRVSARFRPATGVSLQFDYRGRDSDASGDFGSREKNQSSASVTASFRPVKRLSVKATAEYANFSQKALYDGASPSYNRLDYRRGGLMVSYAFPKGATLFAQAQGAEVTSYYRGLTDALSPAFFFGPQYRESSTQVQVGAALPLGGACHLTALAGQTLLHGTQAYRYPFAAATMEVALTEKLSLSLRGQYSEFERGAYSFDSGSYNLIQAVLAWKF